MGEKRMARKKHDTLFPNLRIKKKEKLPKGEAGVLKKRGGTP